MRLRLNFLLAVAAATSVQRPHRVDATRPVIDRMALLQKAASSVQRSTLDTAAFGMAKSSKQGSSLGKGRLTRRQAARAKGWGAEELEDYTDGGLAMASAFSDDRVSSIAASISSQAYGSELSSFVNNQNSRYIRKEGNARAAEYIKKKFQDLGYTVRHQDVDASEPIPAGNILGIKRGKNRKEFVVIGAHFDSVNWQDTEAEAPGAEDNGSGTSALLQVAKALKDVPTDRSIVFVAFNGEEEGTYGSAAFVQELQKHDGDLPGFGKPQAAIIMDEVAYPSPTKNHRRRAIFETQGRLAANVALLDTAYKSYQKESDIVKGIDVNYKGFGSDHIPFLQNGIPAFLLIERDNLDYSDKFGHSARDTLEHTDSEFGAAMARIACRTLLALSSDNDK